MIFGFTDPTQAGGVAYYEVATSPQPVASTINSVKFTADACTPFVFNGTFYELLIGPQVPLPALPLTPVVVP